MQTEYTISTPEEMIELGKSLVESGYKKFWLIGKLGAGKTHFTKWVALGLGLNADQVHSPTYVYFHEYEDKLLHVDMYRMLDSFQIVKMGLEDKLQDYEYWCIEWPKTEWIHDEDLIILNIEIVDNLTRKVKEVKRGSKK